MASHMHARTLRESTKPGRFFRGQWATRNVSEQVTTCRASFGDWSQPHVLHKKQIAKARSESGADWGCCLFDWYSEAHAQLPSDVAEAGRSPAVPGRHEMEVQARASVA